MEEKKKIQIKYKKRLLLFFFLCFGTIFGPALFGFFVVVTQFDTKQNKINFRMGSSIILSSHGLVYASILERIGVSINTPSYLFSLCLALAMACLIYLLILLPFS